MKTKTFLLTASFLLTSFANAVAQSGPPAPPVHPTEKITAETHCLDANGTPKLKSAAVRPGGGSTEGQTRPGLTTGAAPAESGQGFGNLPKCPG